MKPTPLSDNQIDAILNYLDDDLVENYNMYILALVQPDNFLICTDGKEVELSKVSDLIRDDILDTFRTELNVSKYFDDFLLIRKVNLALSDNGAFELIESHKSGDFFKIRDGKGNIFTYYEKDHRKGTKSTISKSLTNKFSFAPDTVLGKDARENLYK